MKNLVREKLSADFEKLMKNNGANVSVKSRKFTDEYVVRDTLIKAQRNKTGFAQNIPNAIRKMFYVAQNPPREYAGLSGAILF